MTGPLRGTKNLLKHLCAHALAGVHKLATFTAQNSIRSVLSTLKRCHLLARRHNTGTIATMRAPSLLLAAMGAIVAGLGCSENGDNRTVIPDAGTGGTIAAGGGEAMSSAGTGGRALPPTGGTGGIGLDAGSIPTADTGTAGSSETDPLAVNEAMGCPKITPEPLPGQRWAIVALNIVGSELIVQNVSGTTQTLTVGHQWCAPTEYERLLPFIAGVPDAEQEEVFEAGEILRVPLTKTDAREIRVTLEREGGEIALFPRDGTFDESDEIMTYMSWGEGQPLGVLSRQSVAAGAFIWPLGTHVAITQNWGGIVAVGPTDRPSGYQSVPVGCLP